MKMNNLKKIGIGFLLTSFISACGDSCYSCRKNSYWNGISYTEPGEIYLECQQEGESDEEFEKRIQETEESDYTCIKK